MREKKAYYSVFALKDGTIWFATQRRKPGRGSKPKIDENGIFNWYLDELDAGEDFTATAKVVRGATIATCLNMKRVVREYVECRIEGLQQQLGQLQEQLDRIEGMLKQNGGNASPSAT
jgi:hypothetical protein